MKNKILLIFLFVAFSSLFQVFGIKRKITPVSKEEIIFELVKKIQRLRLADDQLANLFKTSLDDLLKAKTFIQAFCIALIEKDPERYLGQENPLGFQRPYVLKAFQEHMGKNIKPFIQMYAAKYRFDDWFEKAKKLPKLLEVTTNYVWGIAVEKAKKGKTGVKKLYDSILEENLLKMALGLLCDKEYKKGEEYFAGDNFYLNDFGLSFSINVRRRLFGNSFSISVTKLNSRMSNKALNLLLYILPVAYKSITGKLGRDFSIDLHIALESYDSVEYLPDALFESSFYEKLSSLNVSGFGLCNSKNMSKFSNLKVLTIAKYPKESLPNSIGELGKLEFFVLKDCDKLKSLPDSIGKCGKLQSLVLNGNFRELRFLLGGIGKCKNLQSLVLSGNFKELRFLPDTIRSFKNLRFLSVIEAKELSLSTKSSQLLSDLMKKETVVNFDKR